MSETLVQKFDNLAAAMGRDVSALNAGLPTDSSDKLDIIIDLLNPQRPQSAAQAHTANPSATRASTSPQVFPLYGMNRHTGRLISRVEHLRQSIRDILITRTQTRVMLREYGSGLRDKIDRPQSVTWLAELFISITEALDTWEPRFMLNSISAELGDYAGQPVITLKGELL